MRFFITIKNTIKKIKNLLSYILIYIFEHWVRFLMIILIFSCAIIILRIFPIENTKEVTEQEIRICDVTIQNWGVWLAIIGIPFTAFWAMYQYDKSLAVKQQEKAAEIANEFSKEMVEKLYMVSATLLEDKEYSELIGKIDKFLIERFDIFELKEFIKFNNEKEIKTLKSKIENIVNSKKLQNKYDAILKESYNEDEKRVFPSKFKMLLESTLNRLEYLCMNITSNAAGSKYIYASLHQIFLRSVHVLYIVIAIKNYTSIDKYFINIIDVYNLWNSERKQNINKIKKIDIKIKKMKDKTNKKIEKTNNKMYKEIKKMSHVKPKTI